MRKITDEMIGDNLEGEVAPFSFKMPTGGEEIRGAPLVYVPNLIQKIIQTLEEQDSSARLTWHGGFIPENEIWVKLGGDRGGGIFKATFQIVNVPNPNSVLNTCVFCCFMAGDSTYNLHVALDRYKLQVNKLQGMRWRDFTVKVFLCGDYDFYGKMYGLSGASGCYPCLFCTIHKEDMKIPLSVRGYSPTRSLQSIYENYSEYSAAGFPRKDAQFYSNCISEPIWDIPLDQLQRLQAAKSELEVAKHSKETTEQLATYMVLLYGEQSNVVTQYLLQQAEEQRESVDKLISSIEALCGAMVATALREIPSILSDVMVTATTFRSILAQFGRCHELYDGNYINEYNASQLGSWFLGELTDDVAATTLKNSGGVNTYAVYKKVQKDDLILAVWQNEGVGTQVINFIDGSYQIEGQPDVHGDIITAVTCFANNHNLIPAFDSAVTTQMGLSIDVPPSYGQAEREYFKKKSYSVEFKLQVVSKTETSSIRAAAREAGVDEKRVREWKKTGNGIGRNDEEARQDSMQGPKTPFRRWKKGSVPAVQEKLIARRIVQQRALHVRVLRRDVARFAKDIITNSSFKASPGWISRFMRRHKFVT
eukprot:Em0003g1748a